MQHIKPMHHCVVVYTRMITPSGNGMPPTAMETIKIMLFSVKKKEQVRKKAARMILAVHMKILDAGLTREQSISYP